MKNKGILWHIKNHKKEHKLTGYASPTMKDLEDLIIQISRPIKPSPITEHDKVFFAGIKKYFGKTRKQLEKEIPNGAYETPTAIVGKKSFISIILNLQK